MALNSGILNSILMTNDSADVTYDSMDVIVFGGSNDSLAFSRCIGTSVIATGTNEYIGAGLATDSAIYDLGQGTKLFFDRVSSMQMTAGDLRVYGFQSDTTGVVELNYAFGNTPSAVQTPDGHGGSFLSITNKAGGLVDSVIHFINDPLPIKVA